MNFRLQKVVLKKKNSSYIWINYPSPTEWSWTPHETFLLKSKALFPFSNVLKHWGWNMKIWLIWMREKQKDKGQEFSLERSFSNLFICQRGKVKKK